MTTKVGQVIGLLLLLPAGALIIFLVSGVFGHRYNDSGFGTFHGFVQGRFSSYDNSFFLRFRGRTKPRWHWVRPENYTCECLDVEWAGEETTGSGKLLLPSCVLEQPNSSMAITEDSLLEVLTGSKHDEVAPATRNAVERVYSLFVDAGKGELPFPRHHSYSYEEPAIGNLTHFSLGWRFPYAIYVWGLVWLCVVGYYIGHRAIEIRSEAEPPNAPDAPHAGDY